MIRLVVNHLSYSNSLIICNKFCGSQWGCRFGLDQPIANVAKNRHQGAFRDSIISKLPITYRSSQITSCQSLAIALLSP